MRSKTLALAVALSAFAVPPSAAASPSDFRLPGERPEQQPPPPDLEGPVAPDVPASRRRPSAPAPTPTASGAEPPANAVAPPLVEVPTGLQPAPPASAPPRGTSPAPPPGPAASPTAVAPPEPSAASEPGAAPRRSAPAEQPSSAGEIASAPQESWWWSGLLAAVPLALAALGIAGWAGRRRVRRASGAVAVPHIERPRLGPAPAAPPVRPAEPLQVTLEPLRFALTLMNATLAYRLELANHGSVALTDLAIGADMISAHASMTREEQLSGPRAGNPTQAAPAGRIERLEPGERRVVEGEFRLPLPEIVPIRQGSAALLLPLARFRVEAGGTAPLVRTFAIGQPGQGNALQPFRLDQGPRIYPRLTQHAFA
jgi:hypothetical protein